MKLPLSKAEYKVLEDLATKHGLTVDQGAQLSILCFFKRHDLKLLDHAKKHVDSQVLQAFERGEAK
jgi:hypothetical protein